MSATISRQTKWARAQRAKGLCYCGGRPPEPGKSHCAPRLARLAASNSKRRDALAAAGLCKWCGLGPSETGRTGCRPCRDEHRERNRQWYARKVAEQ